MDILSENPIVAFGNKYKKKYILKEFPFLAESGSENFLCFFPYTKSIPEKFYNQKAFVHYYEYLGKLTNAYLEDLKIEINKNHRKLSLALKYLNEINSLRIHDNKTSTEEIDLIFFIDKEIHYNLLKLIEGIYAPFLSFITHFVFISENKNPSAAQKIFGCVEKLKNTEFSYLVDFYSHTVRNGIAHGDVTFGNNEIVYRDANGNEDVKTMIDIIRYFDDALDLCNGIALALKLFFLSKADLLHDNDIIIPRQIMFEELVQNVSYERWSVKNFVETKIGNKNQLIIMIETNFWDYSSVLYLSMQTAFLSEKYATGYDRYFLNLKCKYASKGWAGFNGIKLTELRENKCDNLMEYAEALENKTIFFIPKFKLPSIFNKFRNIVLILRTGLKYEIDDIKNTLNKNIIDCRYLTTHRNGGYSIIKGSVVLLKNNGDIVDTIHSNIKYIINKIIKETRKQSNILSATKYLRVGYLRVGIFTSDMRKRSLYRGGLGSEFLCAVEMKRLDRIKVPDILNSKVINIGKYKIFWHDNWEGIKRYEAI